MALELAHEGLDDALVILGAAGIVIPAFVRFRITPIVGFLLVGVLVGPMGLGALAKDYPWLGWVTISDYRYAGCGACGGRFSGLVRRKCSAVAWSSDWR
jgi:hypothetical protein